MKHFSILAVMTLSIWGCTNTSPPTTEPASVTTDLTTQAALRVSPTRAKLSQRVTLDMPSPPLREMAVRHQTTMAYVYVQSESHKIALWNYEVDPGTITLDLDQVMGVHFVNGDRTLVRAFPQPGRYTIIAADNLETETENAVNFEVFIDILAD